MMKEVNDLERLIHRGRISMDAQRVRANPVIGSDDGLDDIEHYRCLLSKPGKEIEVYLSVNADDEHLTLSDVLFMLAMDASGCKMLEGYDQLKEEWSAAISGTDGNMEEVDTFWQEYRGRCAQAEELRHFLGESLFGELIHMAPGMPMV